MNKKGMMAAALVGLMSVSMLSGFDSAETADSILDKTVAAQAETKEASAQATFDLNANLNVKDVGMALDIAAKGDMPMQFTVDPLNLGMRASFDLEMMGENMNVAVEMYMVTDEDGTLHTYMKEASSDDTEAAEWDVETVPAEEASKLKDMIDVTKIDYASMPVEYTLAPEAVDVNGVSCYELNTAMTWDDLKNVIKWSTEQAGNVITSEELGELGDVTEQLGDLDQLDDFAAGLVLNMAMDVDAETYKPMRVHIDMDGSDWSIIQTIIPSLMDLTNEDGTPMACELTVSALAIDIVYDYDTPVNVEVPAEAIAAGSAQ